MFAFLGIQNRRQVLRDPEKMRRLRAKKRNLERKLGYYPLYIDIEEGVDAKGVIKKVTDTTRRIEDSPELELLLDVFPENDSPYELLVSRYVPLILLPQFQPGKEFLLRIDPKHENEISFVSCVTPEGTTIDLSGYKVG